MLVLIVTVNVKPEYRERVLEGVMEDARGSQHDEPGCLRFDVIQDEKNPNRIYFYEVYKDEAAFEAHKVAPHFRAWADIPKDWFSEPTTAIRGYNLSPSDEEYR